MELQGEKIETECVTFINCLYVKIGRIPKLNQKT